MKISDVFSRGSLLLFFAGGLTSLVICRWLIADIISRSLANGSFARKKIIVITERGLDVSSRTLKELQRYGYRPGENVRDHERGDLLTRDCCFADAKLWSVGRDLLETRGSKTSIS